MKTQKEGNKNVELKRELSVAARFFTTYALIFYVITVFCAYALLYSAYQEDKKDRRSITINNQILFYNASAGKEYLAIATLRDPVTKQLLIDNDGNEIVTYENITPNKAYGRFYMPIRYYGFNQSKQVYSYACVFEKSNKFPLARVDYLLYPSFQKTEQKTLYIQYR